MMKHLFGKQVLLSFVAGLTLSSAIANAATTEPSVYFHPASKWDVSKTDRHCKIQSQFNNGFIITMSGTQQWVDALNINFRQDVFESGKMYEARIIVPGVVEKTIQAKASNARSLSMNFKNQRQLYKQLSTSGVMDFVVEDNAFRFYMTGLSSGIGNFEKCMSGTDIRVSEQKTESKSLVATSRQLTGSQKPDEGAQIEALKMENKIKAKSKARKKMSEKLAEEIIKNPDMISMDDDLNAKPLAKTAQKEPLADMPPQDIKSPSKLKDMPLDKKEKKIAKDQSALLPLEPIEVAAVPGKTETPAMDKDKEKQPELKPLAKVETATSEKIRTPEPVVNMKKTKANADFRNAPLSMKEQMANKDNDPLLAKISVLQGKIDRLERENLALNDDLKASVKASEQERLQIASENWNLERATMQFNEAERQIKRLGQQLQAERARCNVEKEELETMLFNPQITEEGQLARLADLEGKLMEARQEIARLKRP